MTYTIRKGKHYSGSYWDMLLRAMRGSFRSNGIEVTFRFGKECLVPSPEPEDINKLFGFSVGRDHHQESARIGWRPNGNKIDLFSYTYHRGGRLRPTLLCSVQPGGTYEGWIYLWGKSYTYSVFSPEGKLIARHEEETGPLERDAAKHMLYPYHGGTYPAQATMAIELTRI